MDKEFNDSIDGQNMDSHLEFRCKTLYLNAEHISAACYYIKFSCCKSMQD